MSIPRFPPQSALAVIGVGCRLPGARDVDAFRALLFEGRSALAPLPPERFDVDNYYDPRVGVLGKSYSRLAGVIEHDGGDDDDGDPLHGWALEVAEQTLASAGLAGSSALGDKTVSVVLGHSRGSPFVLEAELAERVDALLSQAALAPGQADAIAAAVRARYGGAPKVERARGSALSSGVAGIIAERFGARGPHMVVDAACASSFASLAIGARALRRGAVDMALVGGISYTEQQTLILFAQSRALSASGSFPFDARADGFVPADGVGMLLLERLDDALAARRPIYGVIRAVGGACDGAGRSLWAPSSAGQARAMRAAYAASDVSLDAVSLIEAHATSTRLGDATEVEALGDVFAARARGAIRIGSVKGNIGHAREAAGAAGLIKVLIALQEQRIPPSINYRAPNPAIRWEDTPLSLVCETADWPRGDTPRVAGVNAFGIGGLNYHVVVQEAPTRESAANAGAAVKAPVAAAPAAEVISATRREPIAVIGLGCRLSSAHDVAQLWRVLGGTPSAPSASEPIDWRRLGIQPKSLASSEPLQLRLIEAALDAMQDAGLDDREIVRGRVGVAVGANYFSDFILQLSLALRVPELLAALRAEGGDDEAVKALDKHLRQHLPPVTSESSGAFSWSGFASRVARTLDLGGPACAVDSGVVASSMAALGVACDALWARDCDAVLFGAAGGWTTDRAYRDVVTASGHGAVAALLVRACDARASGDDIYAVIRSVASASGDDALAVQRALDAAGRPAGSLTLLEGAGSLQTARAAARALGATQGVRISSASEQLGQRLGVADGAASLASAALHVQHGALPSLSGALSVAVDAAHSPRAAALVCAAGIGPGASSGAAVLDTPLDAERGASEPFVVRADSRAAIARTLDALGPSHRAVRCGNVIGRGAVGLGLRVGEGLSERWAMARSVVEDAEITEVLVGRGVAIADVPLSSAQTCFLFPGSGAHYHGMMRNIAQAYPSAAQVLQRIDEILGEMGLSPISDAMWRQPERLGEAMWGQLAVLAGSMMMLEVAAQVGIWPAIVSGYSFGEVAALTAAGALSLDSAVELTVGRNREIARHPRGAMASLFTTVDALQPLLAGLCGFAAPSNLNAPDQVVVSGEPPAIEELLARSAEAGVSAKRLDVPVAFHSALMAPAVPGVGEVIASVRFDRPTRRLLTCIDSVEIDEPDALREALLKQLTLPVDFPRQIERLYQRGVRRFVEIGAGNVLSRLVRKILGDRAAVVVSFDDRRKGDKPGVVTIENALVALRAAEAREGVELSYEEDDGSPRAPESGLFSVAQWAERARRPGWQSFWREASPALRRQAEALYREHRASAAEVPGEAGATAQPRVSTAAVGASLEPYATFLRDKVHELTGYPRELIDFGAHVESELGLDSVQRVELLGWAAERFDIEAPALGGEHDIATLDDLASRMATLAGGGAAQERPSIERLVERYQAAPVLGLTKGVYRPQRLLIVAASEDDALARELASRMRARGSDVAVVAVADAGTSRWLDDAAGSRRSAAERTPYADLCLLVGRGRLARLDRDALADAASVIAGSRQARHELLDPTFALLQRWARGVGDMWAGRTVSAVTASCALPEGGGVAGLLRALGAEAADLRVKLLDSDPGVDPALLADALIDELDSADDTVNVALVDGARAVRRFAQAPVSAPTDGLELGDGAIVITGGARGITAECAVALASRGARALHLLGATPLVDEGAAAKDARLHHKRAEIAQTLARLRDAGAEAHYHAVDVADRAAVADVLARVRTHQAGGIAAVVHGAGVERSCALLAKTAAGYQRTLAAKVDAAINLIELTRDDPLALFVAFTSVAGCVGGPGQTDYAMANAMLARLVDLLAVARPSCRALSLSWSAWDTVGMASRPETRHLLAARGRTFVQVEQGRHLFIDEISRRGQSGEILVVDPRAVGLGAGGDDGSAAPH